MLLLFMVLPPSISSSPTPVQKCSGSEKRGVDGKTSLGHIILCKTRFFLGHLMKIHAVRELTLLTIQKPEFYVIRRTVSLVDRFDPERMGPIFGPRKFLKRFSITSCFTYAFLVQNLIPDLDQKLGRRRSRD